MDRNEKLLLSASEAHGHTFRHGAFMRLYEQSLYWFSIHIKPLKPMLERVKGGKPIVYGGLPIASLEKLLEEGGLCAEAIANGWKWAYAEQPKGIDENFSGFAEWREAAVASIMSAQAKVQQDGLDAHLHGHDGKEGRNILREIRAFNLANSTPIQAMSAVADWQEFLRTGQAVE